MTGLRKHFISLIFIGLSAVGFSQEDLRFKKLTKADGLSNNNIFDITQDDDGFIWFGTRDGLNRYDGYRFKVLQYQDNDSTSLVSNDIRNLYFDTTDQSLWIGTQNGLSRYFVHLNTFENHLPKEFITKVLRDSRGRLLVATSSGLFQFMGDNTFDPIGLNGESFGSIVEITEDSYNQLWVVSDKGIFINSENSWDQFLLASDHYPELAALSGKQVNRICEDQNQNLWFGCENSGLIKWEIADRTVNTYLDDTDDSELVSSNRIRDIVPDQEGDIWVGTSNGIYIVDVDGKQLRHVYNDGSYHEGLSNNSIKSLHVDKKGGIWVGTYFRGVNYYDNSFDRFKIVLPYKDGPDDDQNIIAAVTTDERGNIWIGTEGRGLGRWDNGNNTFHFINKDQLKEINVKTIYPSGDDLWIGTYKKGLIRYSTRTKTSQVFIHDDEDPKSLPNNNIYDIKMINGGMWLASFGAGLVRQVEEGEFRSFNHDPDDPLSISSDDCRLLYIDHDKDFWVGTNDGLNKIVVKNEEVDFERFLPNVTIYSISSFRSDEIWIGTFYKGLFRYNKSTNELVNFTSTDGLPGNTIYSILHEGESLWISTNNGMAKFNTETQEVIGFKHAGELRNLEFSQNAGLVYRNGLFLFGSSNGLVYFKPSEINQSTYHSKLVISDISVLNEKSELSTNLLYCEEGSECEGINLDNHNATLEIELSSLDFSNPANIRYAYRMQGLEENWRYNTGRTKAIYTIQKEGNYVFQARATNSDGIWNPDMLSLNFSVAPPWYRSWWAYLIYVSVSVGLAYLFLRVVRLQNSYHLEHLANLEQEQVHEMKIRFFTNITHEFRTPLTLMLGPLQDMIRSDNTGGTLRTKLQGVYRNVHRLSNLVDQLLVFRKIETDHMKMRVSEGHLDDFLQEIYLAFKDEANKRNIDYQIISEGAIKLWYDPDKMERVFFNLISNALKFAPDMGSISIEIKEEDDQVEVRVNDDGPGVDDSLKELIFERFYERSSTNYSNYGIGIGLSLTKQIVELHSGTVHIENNKPSGSSFVVRLPKGCDHFDQQDLVKEESLNGRLAKENGAVAKTREVKDEHKEIKLLIVEDDKDVSDYLKSIFEEEYSVLVEYNGKSGYDTAKRELPDIIISDVMMPVMDGITMCSRLKTTLETSHIPVVLLTARSSTAYKIGGLETGADDYLTKPFNSEELVLKIKNLLKTREVFLKKIVRIHNFEPEKIAVTSTDEKFLTHLVELTEENIDNSNLTIEQFADELHVSRALLFTKIKALTGQTPKGFVKNYRLKRAAQLLSDSDLKISQISYKCGFRDYRYFTKVFKSQYKMTPKEYREDMRVTMNDL